MRKLYFLIILITSILACGMMTSCDKDKDEMSGVYGYVKEDNKGSCYNFINNNTVVFYSNATLTYTAESYIGKSWWSATDKGEIYTYTFEDNKIYIPQQGTKGIILTKSGDMLIEEITYKEYIKNLKP